MAVKVIYNAKTSRIGVCNACESLVIHKAVAKQAIPLIVNALKEKNVEVRGDEYAMQCDSRIVPASDDDWGMEYLDYIISVKTVDSVDEAIEHINTYNTGHSESIITKDYNNANRFLDEIDAACVYVNASTRFSDGFEFGFGAEIGIDITFSDDPLRMMRCIRFATQLNFYIDDETFEALERNKERIKIISRERIADELNKILLSPVPSKGFIDLDRCGLLELIFPELVALQGVEVRNGRGHKDNFYHTLEVVDNISRVSNDLWLRWATLLHDIGKPRTKRWEPKAGWTFHNHN